MCTRMCGRKVMDSGNDKSDVSLVERAMRSEALTEVQTNSSKSMMQNVQTARTLKSRQNRQTQANLV